MSCSFSEKLKVESKGLHCNFCNLPTLAYNKIIGTQLHCTSYYQLSHLVAFCFQYLEWTLMNVAIESLLFALLHPIKKDWLNIQVLASLCLASLQVLYSLGTQEKQIQLALFIAALPLMYFVMYVAYKLLLWLGILQKCQQKSKTSHCNKSGKVMTSGNKSCVIKNSFQIESNGELQQQLPQNRNNDLCSFSINISCKKHTPL